MEKKKSIFIIIFVLILFLILLSGCIGEGRIPVATIYSHVDWDLELVILYGAIAYPFCKASSTMFVYDTESHENWEDYNYSIGVTPSKPYRFTAGIRDDQVQHHITYYFRAVAYCYDFWGPLRNYEEGYYAGMELTFYVYY